MGVVDENPGGRAPLTDDERRLLDFERQRWKYPAAKEAAVWDTFGWSMTRYHQVLHMLLDRPTAAEYAPVLVARLRRVREARRAARPARRDGLGPTER